MDVLAAAYENPREDVQALVPRDAARILDLGCSSGALGAALTRRQDANVVGVEIDPEYAARARDSLDEVVEGDLETLSLAGRGPFDCVVAADVLEHLRWPDRVLAAAVAELRPGGTAVVSLPNIRYWETFWALGVRGTFPRHSLGLFDRTHLRWFTLRDAWVLMEDAGLQVSAVARQLRMHRERAPLTGAAARVAGALPGVRTFLTYQHVLAGTRR